MLFVFSFGPRRNCVRQLNPETGGGRGKRILTECRRHSKKSFAVLRVSLSSRLRARAKITSHSGARVGSQIMNRFLQLRTLRIALLRAAARRRPTAANLFLREPLEVSVGKDANRLRHRAWYHKCPCLIIMETGVQSHWDVPRNKPAWSIRKKRG